MAAAAGSSVVARNVRWMRSSSNPMPVGNAGNRNASTDQSVRSHTCTSWAAGMRASNLSCPTTKRLVNGSRNGNSPGPSPDRPISDSRTPAAE